MCKALVGNGPNEELKYRLWFEHAIGVSRTSELHWLGNIERKNKNNWLKYIHIFVVECRVIVGGPNVF